LPSSLPKDSITSFEALYPPQSISIRGPSGSALWFNVKVISLYSNTREFLRVLGDRKPTASPELWQTFQELSTALSECHHILPALDDPRGLQTFETVGPVNPHLATAHFGLHVCTMLLFNILIPKAGPGLDPDGMEVEVEGESYRTVLGAAYHLTSLIQRFRWSGSLPRIFGYVFLIPYTYTGVEVILRELWRTRAQASPFEIKRFNAADQGLMVLLDILYDLTNLYPAWLQCMHKLKPLLKGGQAYDTI